MPHQKSGGDELNLHPSVCIRGLEDTEQGGQQTGEGHEGEADARAGLVHVGHLPIVDTTDDE